MSPTVVGGSPGENLGLPDETAMASIFDVVFFLSIVLEILGPRFVTSVESDDSNIKVSKKTIDVMVW